MADRFAPDELPNSLPALLTLHSDLRRFMSEEKPAADEKLRRCVTLRAAVKTVATEGLAAREGAVVFTSVDNSDAERQMAALEAAVARHCDDLAQELKRHHALADSAHRFTSDAAELLVGPSRTAPATPPTLF